MKSSQYVPLLLVLMQKLEMKEGILSNVTIVFFLSLSLSLLCSVCLSACLCLSLPLSLYDTVSVLFQLKLGCLSLIIRSMCLSFFFSLYLCLPLSLFLSPSVSLFLTLSFCLSLYLSYVFPPPSVCLHCLSLYLCRCISLSVSRFLTVSARQ